jgi:hypothetical protein
MTRDYDGFYFLPGDDDDELKLAYFKLKEEEFLGEPVDNTILGDMYHIAFFKWSDGGHPIFDEHYEAIFSDPSTYIKNISGADLYGCILRKTEKSGKWWKDYLKRTMESCTMIQDKMKIAANT